MATPNPQTTVKNGEDTTIASNEAQINTLGQTTDVTKTDMTSPTREEMNATETAPIGTPPNEMTVDKTDSTDQTLLEKQQEAEKTNQAELDKLNAEALAQKQTEAQAFAEGQISAEEQYAKDNEALIRASEAEQNALDQGTILKAEERAQRDSLALQKKKESELSYLRMQQESLRVQNENAITKAKMDIDIQRQQSAWAYHKLGLGFSSGIINQSQQIATQGIAKIAEIKAKMNLDEATNATNIAKIEFEYTSLVNGVIDKYNDLITDTKKEMKERINLNKKDLLKSNFEKKKSIDEITKWAREEKSRLEKEHIAEIRTVQDRGLALAKEVEATRQNQLNIAKTNINDRVADGSLFTMSDVELNKLATKAGLTINELNSLKDTSIASAVGKVATRLIGEDYIIGEVDRLKINDGVNSLLAQGRTLQDATETATKKVLENSKEYKDKLKLQDLETKAKEAKFNEAIRDFYSSGSGSGGGYKPKAGDIDKTIMPDGTVVYTNKITQDSWVATIKGDPVYVGKSQGPIVSSVFRAPDVPLKSQQNKNILTGEGSSDGGVVDAVFN